MGLQTNSQLAITAWEDRLIKRALWVVLCIHLLIMVLDWSMFTREPIELAWEVDTEWIDDKPSAPSLQDSIKDQPPGKTFAIDEQILPQLPKVVDLIPENTPPPRSETPAEEAVLPPPPAQAAPPPKAPEAVPETETEKKLAQQIKDRALARITKEDAIKRLLKEKARLEDKKDKTAQSPLHENLIKRLDTLQKQQGPVGLLGESTYGKSLKKRIAKFYALPEVYNLRDANLKAVVHMRVDAQGQLVTVTLAQSSQDEAFDQLALKTIQDAAPFPQPPADWVGKVITVPFEPTKKR